MAVLTVRVSVIQEEEVVKAGLGAWQVLGSSVPD